MFSGLSRSLGARLLAAVLAISTLILAAVGVTSYLTTRNLVVAQARDQAQALADRSALAIDGQFAPLYAIPGAIAANEQRDVDGDTRLEQLQQTLPAQLERLPSVLGMYMTFARNALPQQEYAEVWYVRDGDAITPYYSNIPGNPGYNAAEGVNQFQDESWYADAVRTGRTIWTEPYVDSTSGIGMVSATTPVTVDGKLLGVTGVDISLEEVQQLVDGTHPTANSYAMVVGETGTFIANPRFPDSVLTQTIDEFATAQNNEAIAQLGKAMMAGETGLLEVRDPATGQLAWAAYQPVQTTGWSTAVIIPQRDLLGGLDPTPHACDRDRQWGISTFSVFVVSAGTLDHAAASPTYHRRAGHGGRQFCEPCELDAPRRDRHTGNQFQQHGAIAARAHCPTTAHQ